MGGRMYAGTSATGGVRHANDVGCSWARQSENNLMH